MKKRPLALLLAAVLATLSCACGSRLAGPEKEKEPDALTVALEKDCPRPVADALQAFCDDIYQLSGKSLYASLQYWEDVSGVQADILFLPDARLLPLSPELSILRTDFLFESYSHFDQAMNAPAILQALGGPLAARGYSPYLCTYGGKRSLLCTDGSFVEALRSDESSTIREMVEDLKAGAIAMQPADFSLPPQDEVLYYADTVALSGLSEQAAEDYIIVNLNYLYHFNLLCLQEGLQERLSAHQWAAVQEAAAILKPACDTAFQALDTQGSRRFASAMIPSQKLRRVVTEMQAASSSIWASALYRQIWQYSD